VPAVLLICLLSHQAEEHCAGIPAGNKQAVARAKRAPPVAGCPLDCACGGLAKCLLGGNAAVGPHGHAPVPVCICPSRNCDASLCLKSGLSLFAGDMRAEEGIR
jgi:hypothetical protein